MLRIQKFLGDIGVAPDDAVAPVMTTYILRVCTAAHPVRDIGPRNVRELRSWCLPMGHFMRGDTDKGLDVMAQRAKALEKSIVDGTLDTARWLELIPTGQSMLVGRREATGAVKEGIAEEKSRRVPNVSLRSRNDKEGDKEKH